MASGVGAGVAGGGGGGSSVTIAISILTRAVTLDTEQRYTESLVCYQEGIQILMQVLRDEITDDAKKKAIRNKVDEYMGRAEKLKKHMETLKSAGNYREQLQIREDSTGHSYHSVFSRFMDSTVNEIYVDDPYIRSPHQCDNFLRFVELSVRLCASLRRIHLMTGVDSKQSADQQKQRLATIANSLKQFEGKGIQLIVTFSDSLHDREVRLDNGWVVKIGRGLDYFKPVDRFCIGWTDFDLRPCRETTIDIFHKKELVRCR